MKRSHQTIQTLSFWDSIQESRTNKAFRLAESGRSMVEMLGVLGIIGVLSVGAVVGYKYATSKHVANTIMSELNLRAVPLSQMRIQNQMAAGTTLHLEAGDKIASGHTISAKVSINPEYFEMTVNGVQQQSCEMILEDYITSSWITVNNTLYENTTSICNAEENDMTFVYSNNLGERRTCSQKGLFNVNSYKCECDGGTYFDNGKKDCACPAGHIWSESERKCIESRCQEGEFEALDSGCVSCEDPNGYTISQDDNSIALCQACPNRRFSTIYDLCLLNICEKGISFPNEEQNCILCSAGSTHYSSDNTTEYGREYCNACPNRHASSSACILDNICTGRTFYALWDGGCVSCDDSYAYKIGYSKAEYNRFPVGQEEIDACLACTNEMGVKNRYVYEEGSHTYCAKSVCDPDEFMGKDGKCYSCQNEYRSIEVTDSAECISETCGRIYQSGSCKLKICDTIENKNVLLSDGSCWPCDTKEIFEATQAECDACGLREDGEPKRFFVYSSSGQTLCRINNCELGKSYPFNSQINPVGSNGYLCYSCKGYHDGVGIIGVIGSQTKTSADSKRYCEACGNYFVNGLCYSKNSCEQGEEFRGVSQFYKFCTSCDYIDKVRIENHEEHRKMCTDCTTTPRFFAMNADEGYEYCYRCDSNEAPVVTTSAERASCTACPNRQINADNQCVLIKTEN